MTAVAEPQAQAATGDAADDLDLAVFNDAVTNAISDRSPTEADIAAVRAAYQALEPRKGKLAARNAIKDDIRNAIANRDIELAQALVAVEDGMSKAVGRPSAGVSPKNATAAHIERVVSIQLGYSLAYTNVPAHVASDWADSVKIDAELERQSQEYRRWLETGQKNDQPEPNVPEVAKMGARISLGRGPKGQGRKPKQDAQAQAAAPQVNTPPPPPVASAPAGNGNGLLSPAPAAPGSAPDGWEV